MQTCESTVFTLALDSSAGFTGDHIHLLSLERLASIPKTSRHVKGFALLFAEKRV